MSHEVIIALIAISSPLIVGLLKELLSSRKVKADSTIASFQEVEKRNEFLTRQIDILTKRAEEWQDKYYLEHEKVIRFEMRHELRRMSRDETHPSLPPSIEGELEYMHEFQTETDAVIFSNADGRIVGVNDKACQMFGYVKIEIEGQPVEILVPENLRPAHNAGMERLRMGMSNRISGKTIPLQGLHKDGHTFPIEITVNTFITNGLQYCAAVIHEGHEHLALLES